MPCYVYILASRRNGTLYTGVTNNLVRRVYEHRAHVVEGFTEKYDVTQLVHYEIFDDIRDAIQREKNLKKWPRAWKLALIEGSNPQWNDPLFDHPAVIPVTASSTGRAALDRRVKPGDDNGGE